MEAGQWERCGKDKAVATVRGEFRERVPSCRGLVVGGEVPKTRLERQPRARPQGLPDSSAVWPRASGSLSLCPSCFV